MKKWGLCILILIAFVLLILPVTAAINGKIAFSSYADGSSKITLMNANESGVTPLRYGSNPAWSPDGQKIAYTDTIVGDIYVMNTDGTGRTRLTTSPGWDDQPAWSPDGTKIAFASNRTGYFNIYVMNKDGTGQINFNTSGSDTHPAWSPDGTKIAFDRTLASHTTIYVMNSDGTGQKKLTWDDVANRRGHRMARKLYTPIPLLLILCNQRRRHRHDAPHNKCCVQMMNPHGHRMAQKLHLNRTVMAIMRSMS